MREGLVREDDGNGGFGKVCVCGEVGVGIWRWVLVWGVVCGEVCVGR